MLDYDGLESALDKLQECSMTLEAESHWENGSWVAHPEFQTKVRDLREEILGAINERDVQIEYVRQHLGGFFRDRPNLRPAGMALFARSKIRKQRKRIDELESVLTRLHQLMDFEDPARDEEPMIFEDAGAINAAMVDAYRLIDEEAET